MAQVNIAEQLELARAKMELAELSARTKLIEGMTLLYGNGSASQMAGDDPRGSDDGEVWDEVGLKGANRMGARHPTSERDLNDARDISRNLAGDNGFAIGAMEARVSYIVGTGLKWRAVAKDKETPKEATQEINDAIKAFSKANKLTDVEQESVRRADRDGESIVRTFPNNAKPLDVRFVEPEDVRAPIDPSLAKNAAFGVQVDPGDVVAIEGYWITGEDGEPALVPINHDQGENPLPQVLHLKANVDMNSRRGWPTLWAARRNFSRAEKLLRGMSVVAAVQSQIAVIRKHDTATKNQVESFLEANRDLLVQDTNTGRSTNYTKLNAATVLDVGPGTTYEVPISSVNASNNISILQADLREIAALLQMPEFMLTANAQNADLASTLVAEGPATKSFERLQQRRGNFLKEIVEAGLQHDVNRGVLSQELLDAHDIVATYPLVISRNRLNEAQRFEIEKRNKVVSIKTWRGVAGYDHDTEKTNIEEEQEEAIAAAPPALAPNMVTQPGQDPETGGPPPPNTGDRQRSDDQEANMPRDK